MDDIHIHSILAKAFSDFDKTQNNKHANNSFSSYTIFIFVIYWRLQAAWSVVSPAHSCPFIKVLGNANDRECGYHRNSIEFFCIYFFGKETVHKLWYFSSYNNKLLATHCSIALDIPLCLDIIMEDSWSRSVFQTQTVDPGWGKGNLEL